ncbi:hypothetical protein Y1Q_0007883 [Alligator mississippiensis]|uniref:Uncharacterized protein n=1 Tax=Alligator mississippiensis TaxID=8496 RepID=A0A151NER9_ALLMI|nr:hypothetical protein Y1Q_0007883 [Alligator mississippiensis]
MVPPFVLVVFHGLEKGGTELHLSTYPPNRWNRLQPLATSLISKQGEGETSVRVQRRENSALHLIDGETEAERERK